MTLLLSTLGVLAITPPSTAAVTVSSDTTRICLAVTTAQVPSGSAADAATAVRESFVSLLAGPTLSATPLTSHLTSQAREEAKQNGCVYVLFTALVHERKKGNGLLGRVASSAVESGAYEVRGAAGSAAARVVASAAASAASSAARALADNVKSKDELTLDYRLETPDGAVVVKSTEKAKASADGQDLLTPLVERAAEAVATAGTKPRGK
jgi:hypothetical protein